MRRSINQWNQSVMNGILYPPRSDARTTSTKYMRITDLVQITRRNDASFIRLARIANRNTYASFMPYQRLMQCTSTYTIPYDYNIIIVVQDIRSIVREAYCGRSTGNKWLGKSLGITQYEQKDYLQSPPKFGDAGSTSLGLHDSPGSSWNLLAKTRSCVRQGRA